MCSISYLVSPKKTEPKSCNYFYRQCQLFYYGKQTHTNTHKHTHTHTHTHTHMHTHTCTHIHTHTQIHTHLHTHIHKKTKVGFHFYRDYFYEKKKLLNYCDVSFYPIFKNFGPKCLEDQGLSKMGTKKFFERVYSGQIKPKIKKLGYLDPKS